uniref:Peroxiredoxin-6 n=1 Tax=Mastacembelus armatus TaxID=205130 RepID=A0A3Q3MQP7_9TELE
MPGLLLGDEFPNFEADTTIGRIKFHDFLGSSWGILFSHPKDFTPVCTTELARAAKISSEFKKRDVKMIALSIDSVEDHHNWSKDVMAFNSEADNALPFPIIADDKRVLSVQLGMLDPDEKDKDGMPLTARCVFVIGPDKRMKLSILYPATTGRNFDELLRVIDSLQLTAQKKVATPVDWKGSSLERWAIHHPLNPARLHLLWVWESQIAACPDQTQHLLPGGRWTERARPQEKNPERRVRGKERGRAKIKKVRTKKNVNPSPLTSR